MSGAAQAGPRSPRLLIGLAAAAMAILCGLGAWQLQRREEKGAFLARLAAQAEAPPASLPARERWAGLDLDSADLTRVTASGEWLPGATATVRVAMVRPEGADRRPGGFGRYLIAALRLPDGGVILVNRGFAPEEAQAALPAPSGPATLTGILRKPEPSNAFTPAPDPARRDFHLRDPKAIASALGVEAAPFMIEAERGPDRQALPVGVDIRDMIARVPNNHLQYALTWFGLAVTLAGVLAAFLRAGRRAGAGAGGRSDL